MVTVPFSLPFTWTAISTAEATVLALVRHGPLRLAAHLPRLSGEAQGLPQLLGDVGGEGIQQQEQVLQVARVQPLAESSFTMVIMAAMAVFIFKESMSSVTFLMVLWMMASLAGVTS